MIKDISKREFLLSALATTSLAALSVTRVAAQNKPQSQTLVRNVRIFDGDTNKLSAPQDILIEGDLIKDISPGIKVESGVVVEVDGKGQVLMPGLIDAHVHLSWNQGPFTVMQTPPDYLAALTLTEAKNTLMRGFTSVRDTGGITTRCSARD